MWDRCGPYATSRFRDLARGHRLWESLCLIMDAARSPAVATARDMVALAAHVRGGVFWVGEPGQVASAGEYWSKPRVREVLTLWRATTLA